jgi:hypothetical protein
MELGLALREARARAEGESEAEEEPERASRDDPLSPASNVHSMNHFPSDSNDNLRPLEPTYGHEHGKEKYTVKERATDPELPTNGEAGR